MKLLVIDEEFPWPLNTGKRLRTFNLIHALTKYNEVSYLAYGEEKSESFRALQERNITCHAVEPPDRRQSGAGFYMRLAANLGSPLPYIVTSHYTERFEQRMRELIEQHKYDLVICEWTPYALYLRRLTTTKSIIVAHNIESNIWRRYVQTTANPLKRFYISLQYDKVRTFEKKCFSWSEGATAVSTIEAKEIASYGPPYRVETVENGVDVDYFSPREDAPDPNMVVFTGSMDWRPNQDAVEFFVRDILPLMQKERPGLKFIAVGRKPPQHIIDLHKRPGVAITGTVDDVRPYIARAGLYVVPLRVGGGSRLKILEAMSMKKPVLSTTVGAEGLDITDGQNIVLADSASAFAQTALELLNDADRCNSLAEAGHTLVHEKYRWDILGEKLNRYLKSVVGI